MVLIVRRENPWAPFVQGLSQGLERYGQMYNTQKALEGMNYSPEKAAAIARMPEYMQKMFIQQGADDAWLKNLGIAKGLVSTISQIEPFSVRTTSIQVAL